jgi:hypothetical protein
VQPEPPAISPDDASAQPHTLAIEPCLQPVEIFHVDPVKAHAIVNALAGPVIVTGGDTGFEIDNAGIGPYVGEFCQRVTPDILEIDGALSDLAPVSRTPGLMVQAGRVMR